MAIASQSPLETAFRRASEARPEVGLSEAAFTAWVSAAGITMDRLLKHDKDLFLAAACAAGDPGAVAALEREVITRVPDFVARFHLTPEMLDELSQRVRILLLTGERPRIGNYRGYGPLGAWARICTIRSALNMCAQLGGDEIDEDDAWSMLAGVDPALDRLLDQQRHRETLSAALEQALTRLQPREKTLLRMHLVDGLGLDQLALIFHVHRATAARWLAGVRRQVLAHLQQEMALHLGARPSEIRSIVRVLQSQLQVNVRRALGALDTLT